jgi:antitoxin HicB
MKKATSKNRDVAYYLSLPYAIGVRPLTDDEGGGFNACIPLLGRYSAQGDGDTAEEAIADLRLFLPSLIKDWIARGVEIPEPAQPVESRYNGTLTIRVPKSLHAKVAHKAHDENVSINQFVATTLAAAVGP